MKDSIEILHDLVASNFDKQDTQYGILSGEQLDALLEATELMRAVDKLWSKHQRRFPERPHSASTATPNHTSTEKGLTNTA